MEPGGGVSGYTCKGLGLGLGLARAYNLLMLISPECREER